MQKSKGALLLHFKMCDNITLQFEVPPAALCLGGVKLNPSRLNRNPSVPVCSLLRQA